MGVAGENTEVSLNLSSDFFSSLLPSSQTVSMWVEGAARQLRTAWAGSACAARGVLS